MNPTLEQSSQGNHQWLGCPKSSFGYLSLPLMCALLLTVPGCKGYCGDQDSHYGTCEGVSQLSGFTFGEKSFANDEIATEIWLACGYSYGESLDAPRTAGGIECFNPATPIEDWESQDWGILVVFHRPEEAQGCGVTATGDAVMIEIVFDVSEFKPASGKIVDVTTAKYSNVYGAAYNADYVVSGGKIVITEAAEENYSYKIVDLTLSKTFDHNNPVFSECYTPDTIVVGDTSVSCEPAVYENTTC